MAQSSRTVVGPASYFAGQLKSDEDIHVDGIVEGPVQTSRNVTIGASAEVRGPVSATDIVLDGVVIGDVLAHGMLTIGPSGRLIGDIRSAGLRIHDGGTFTGHVEMLGDSSVIPPVSTAADVLTAEPSTEFDDDPAEVTDEGPPAWNSDQHRAVEANLPVESSTLDPPVADGMELDGRPLSEIGVEASDLIDDERLSDEDDTEDPEMDAPPIHETDDLPELLLPGRRRGPARKPQRHRSKRIK
jgi:cytoskeletal protein CcmA (bactofilin family)